MSAYIVDRQHILFLVGAAMRGIMQPQHGPFRWGLKDETKPGQWRGEQLGCLDYEKAAEVANLLWRENIKSVSHRYPNESSATLPGPIGEDFTIKPRAFFVWREKPELAQVFKACDCYEYQSSEHPGWEASEAKAFIDALRKAAWHALPGYEDAAWGAPEKLAAV